MENTHRRSLFVASCIALVVAAFSFAVRGDIMGDLETQFSLSKQQLGWIAGPAFWGFTLAMVFGGPFCDFVGMKKLIVVAFVGHIAGILITIFAAGFWMLFAGTLLIGIANGFIEAACNPLVATLYDKDKTKMLNRFHVWFPGGMVVGGLAVFGMSELSKLAGYGWVDWQWKMGLMLIPTIVYGAMFLPHKLPVTERVASGISTGRMFQACLSPLFLVMLVAMLLTASTELGPTQWIPNILGHTLEASGNKVSLFGVAIAIPGILVLVWVSALMAIGRQFAGPVVHKLSPVGVLIGSALLSAIGLFLLSKSNSVGTAFGAATVFAMGICYFWPTMLGFVSERLPETGALGLSTFGGAGMLSVSIVLPIMGRHYDKQTSAAVPEGYLVEAIKLPEASPEDKAVWAKAQAEGGASTLGAVTVLPITLLVIFGGVYAFDRRSRGGKGGHIEVDPEAIAAAEHAPPPSPAP